MVDLDIQPRVFSVQNTLYLPIMIFTDFGAAFPSLIHDWLFIVLKASGIPIGMFNLIKGMHSFAIAVGRVRSDVMNLFLILSGVIQGNPIASLCFVTAFDPFLNFFASAIIQKAKGIVRACADDAGCVLASTSDLHVVACIFKIAKLLAVLDIKFKKSTIAPLSVWSLPLLPN